ncbi:MULTISPECIES: ABC-three component system protein [unclassified Halomonas]|uniref:ABC-three component system protein n=1 Tax=unclassified Halomonas TaxID=2609666 RepID=UPI000C91A860|nr:MULTISPECIES: ABC-three component system protein [unclassified Halomonas]MAR71003.1 hypothetical protein [Halomonas sp.]|tara:strand:+ start:2125 stop:3339 length:1215 start_codon:yes stop_codon:yes gene_type:complete
MTDAKLNQFAAVDPALGYLYQVRSALLWTLKRLKSEPDFLVGIETLDDVAFESVGGDPRELLQTKHHRNAAASLTDASTDLWKTLRIWFEETASGEVPSTASLCLVTTGEASDGSAASYLRGSNRDVQAALTRLDATAQSSSSAANKPAYAVYLEASPAQRAALLARVTVLDVAPTVNDLDGELRREVFWAVDKEHHAAFLDRLEGWWLRRVLDQLSSTNGDRIGSVEVEAQMSDLREGFKQESLPIDDDLLEFNLDEATRAAHENSNFVHQLDLIKAGKRRVAAAIRDYYRAFEQRSRWLRDELVVGLDLRRYEKRLIEEWDLVFEGMRDELGDGPTDRAKEEAARSVLKWAERASVLIRPSVTEPFVCRGSLHMLADELRVGWHPEFRYRLAHLLAGEEGAA